MEAQWSDSLQLGDLNIKNRVIMAALTRERCDPDLCVPTPLLQEYYSQRAGSGFILTEATSWSLRGRGFIGAACLYNEAQM
jgi:N-ethylmaleimide reductase